MQLNVDRHDSQHNGIRPYDAMPNDARLNVKNVLLSVAI
jgi:hypothetical protein